jgi:hypothetical protein
MVVDGLDESLGVEMVQIHDFNHLNFEALA